VRTQVEIPPEKENHGRQRNPAEENPAERRWCRQQAGPRHLQNGRPRDPGSRQAGKRNEIQTREVVQQNAELQSSETKLSSRQNPDPEIQAEQAGRT